MPVTKQGNCLDCGHPAIAHDGHTGRCAVVGCNCATCDWAIDAMADQIASSLSTATGIPESDIPQAFQDGRLVITHHSVRGPGGTPSGIVVERGTVYVDNVFKAIRGEVREATIVDPNRRS